MNDPDRVIEIEGDKAFLSYKSEPREPRALLGTLTHDPRLFAQPWECRAVGDHYAAYDQTPEKAAARLADALLAVFAAGEDDL